MKKVAIVEYGLGNLDSVARAVEENGGKPIVTHEVREIESAQYIILPGVGAFAVGMQNLRKLGLCQILEKPVMGSGVPFLGICLGMQLMAAKGWEGGVETAGLGWIDGEVRKLQPQSLEERVPHVGWNEVVFAKPSRLFEGISQQKDFYFVHSYHLSCHNRADVLATTDYCGGFVSAVGRGQLFGTQFHPEKSQRAGFQVLKNFLSL